MMRVLITGARGYIGGRLVPVLAADSAFAVTAASRGRHPAQAGVAVATVDWDDAGSLAAMCRSQDTVVHLAAMSDPACEKDPEGAVRFNGLATLALLRAAEAAGARRFLYVSTAKVFGLNPAGVLDESAPPRPAGHYAITHRLAEDYVLAAHDRKRIQGVVLRLANAVGAPADPATADWSLIANDMCRQAATMGQIVLKGSGLVWRNFIPMADVAAALRHVAVMPESSLGNGLFHLGGSTPLRIWDLAGRVAARAEALFGGKVKLERAEPAPGERHPVLDWRIGKLMATGWMPRSDLDSEIDATLRLCRATFKAAR